MLKKILRGEKLQTVENSKLGQWTDTGEKLTEAVVDNSHKGINSRP